MHYYVAALILSLAVLRASGLTGPHVCHRVVNYTVTSREQYEEPVEILTLEWCMQIPPRCPRTRTELRQRWRMKSEVKYKSVPECCDGYVTQELVGSAGSGEAKCVPKCERCPAARGSCEAPNECICEEGYQGQDCSNECPAGSWGKNCKNECNCLSDLACNPRSGKCDCPPGYSGARCEKKCPEGYWGVRCSSICLCENSQSSCDHVTGECPPAGATPTSVLEDVYEASGNLVPSKSADFIDFDAKDFIPELAEHESITAPAPSLPDDMIPVSTPRAPKSTRFTSTATTEGSQLLQPETRKPSDDADAEIDDGNFRVVHSPKTEYVKTSLKGGASAGAGGAVPPTDVAAMIAVGALVSVGLASLAAVMIFHARARLLKAALSIYNREKLERQFAPEKSEPQKLDFTISTLPRGTMTINPTYENSTVGPPLVTTESPGPVAAEYANGTVTIGIRLSSNLRDLLESHYDRPAVQPQPQQQQRPEDHVYDEIPLAAPFQSAATKYS